MHKIGEINPKNGKKMVIFYDDKVKLNPYRVYLTWNELTDHGCYARRRQIARYANLHSCGLLMAEHTRVHDEEAR